MTRPRLLLVLPDRGCIGKTTVSEQLIAMRSLPIATGTLQGDLPKKPTMSSNADRPTEDTDGKAKHADGTASPTTDPKPLRREIAEDELS